MRHSIRQRPALVIVARVALPDLTRGDLPTLAAGTAGYPVMAPGPHALDGLPGDLGHRAG